MTFLIFIIALLLFFFWRIWSSKPENIGKVGEKRVASKLNWLAKEYITLHDVLLPTRYGTTQIDHIVVSPYAIFVIETKNYKGWISGHQDAEEWKQSLSGGEQYKFRNPIRQNLAHFQAVRAILKDIGDFTIIPIVAFSDSAELKITAPYHTVINWCNLHSVIKSYKTPTISPENIQCIIKKLTTKNITIEGSRDQHTRNVKTIQRNREMAIANLRCPKCGGNLVERNGKYGKFWGCSNYPRCRFTYND